MPIGCGNAGGSLEGFLVGEDRAQQQDRQDEEELHHVSKRELSLGHDHLRPQREQDWLVTGGQTRMDMPDHANTGNFLLDQKPDRGFSGTK